MKKIVVLYGLLLSILLTACGGPAATAQAPVATPISMQALNDQYGVEITLIGSTAAGGLIDFRYRVVDAAKASALLGKDKAIPALVLASGAMLTTTTTTMADRPEDRVVYYMLFGNSQNAVKAGDPIAVQFGDLRTEPAPAQ